MSMKKTVFAILVLFAAMLTTYGGVQFPGPEPGLAKSSKNGQTFTLENDVIAMTWEIRNHTLAPASLANKLNSLRFDQRGNPLFRLTRAEAVTDLPAALKNLSADACQIETAPKLVEIQGSSAGARLADRFGGKAIECILISSQGVRVRWRAELLDGSHYIHQSFSVEAMSNTPVRLSNIELLDLHLPGAKTAGVVPGCPVVGSGMFAGVEMPGSQNTVAGNDVRVGFTCQLELSARQSYSFGTVVGVAPEGQMRRAFLCYLERERARPSKPFLHYNCWYDLGFAADAAKILDVVSNFNTELVQKRGVPVESYLVDDGWDTPGHGLWAENTNKFPGGFAALGKQMKRLNAHLAIWISPLGGYGGNAERTATAQKMGLIPEDAKLDLAYPGYKKWFQDRCLQLMSEDGVNAFKWDKAGEGVSPHFMALLDIARNLRKQNPDVFINVTVGTWPSPFWLNHVDSTWRNGSADVGWAGKGRVAGNKFDRERWLTFRDGNCRKFFVEKSPLYPLNSVMVHGIVHGRNFQGGDIGKNNPPDLKNEARSYFAIGSSLQELYLTPSLMTSNSWNQVAEAARWAHANADVLVDSHWVGGDPLKLQVYGYAAWSPRKGTLMLRNPNDQPQSIRIDPARAFELPEGAPKKFTVANPFPDQNIGVSELVAGTETEFTLQPFEVLVIEALP